MNMSDHHSHEHSHESAESGYSLRTFINTIRAYLPNILLSLAAVAIGYGILSIAMYMRAPTQQVTSQPFRLEFNGATAGRYPNGMKFSAAEVVNTPILLQVFNDNRLDRYTTFPDFTKSVYVVEANAAYEALAAEYQARLSDPRLGPVDRDRIQKEFDLKRQSLSKNEYSINFVSTPKTDRVPPSLVRKVLANILAAWANFATNEQHVVEYRLAVLSPNIIDETALEGDEPLIAVQVLRSRLMRVLANIDELSELPAADLARTQKDKLSLAEIRVRIEEIIRFRLEPLVPLIVRAGLIRQPQVTVQFLENQLSYDARQLKASNERAEAIRTALAVYSNTNAATAAAQKQPGAMGSSEQGETVMPQLSDSFLERLMSLTSNAADSEYRQKLVDQYRKATAEVIPLEQAVAYNTEILQQVRQGVGRGGDPSAVATQINGTRSEARSLIGSVNEIYLQVSRNLNPSTQLYAQAGPASTRRERSMGLSRVALWGVLTMLLALPIIIAVCLIHARFRQEEAEAESQHAPHLSLESEASIRGSSLDTRR
jgi:hypothetical protein